jgi:hypothetical protein
MEQSKKTLSLRKLIIWKALNGIQQTTLNHVESISGMHHGAATLLNNVLDKEKFRICGKTLYVQAQQPM